MQKLGASKAFPLRRSPFLRLFFLNSCSNVREIGEKMEMNAQNKLKKRMKMRMGKQTNNLESVINKRLKDGVVEEAGRGSRGWGSGRGWTR